MRLTTSKRSHQRPPSRLRARRTALGVLAALTLTAACASTPATPKATSTPTPNGPAMISFAVYGPPQELAAYSKIAAEFNAAHPETVVTVKPYTSREAAMTALAAARAKGDPPDLFLMDHQDLTALTKEKALRRVDDLLGERRVDFGDGYSRNGLEAFSADSALQCMPADASPLVVYYNPRLIDLTTVAEPGRNEVNQQDGWSLDEFAAAARQPRAPGVRGVYVAPTLEQIAPFVWSGGGEVVDDLDDPTTLQLSDGSSATAMEKLLEILRDPGLTFNQTQLGRRSALERFEAGKLGMMLGYRDLTPVLREKQDLLFDVMPMPRLSTKATTASFQGLCISAGGDHVDRTADFLTYLVSDKSASELAATGYSMPTNLSVLTSEAFAQTDQRPLHSEVFVKEVRNARPLPDTQTWPAVESVTEVALTDLFYEPVIDPLADRLAAIDAASMPIFDPKMSPSPSPTPSSTTTTSPSPSP